MKYIAATIPNGNARLELLPGLGHVPFLEDAGTLGASAGRLLKEGR